MKRLREKKGESIAETLVAVLIMAMSLTILAGAIVSAAKVNSKFDNSSEAVIGPVKTGSGSIYVKDSTGSTKASFTVEIYEAGNGTGNEYYYYETGEAE